MPCTPSELTGTMIPCTTSGVAPTNPPGIVPPRRTNVLYVINSAAANPAVPNSDPTLPAGPNNDPFLDAEVPNQAIETTGSIQPGAGSQAAVLWAWVRINIKTERASGEDIDFNAGNNNDDEPIFSYQGRHYRRPDLLAMDPTSQILPAPWGPPPIQGSGRMCVAPVCAAPVYMITAFSIIPGITPAGRVVRSEVGQGTGFSINSGILSEPLIDVSGGSTYIGYDQCDPGCPQGMPDNTTGMDKNDNPYTAFTGDPGFIPGCSTVLPVQSNAPLGSSVLSNNSARSYPNVCTNSAATQAYACVEEGAPFPFDVPEIIDMLRPMATPLAPGNYQGLPDGVDSIGGFPPPPYPASLASQTGAGADPEITYVGGGFKCTAGCTGAGILIVDCPTCTAAQPALTLDASMEFYGLIIVNGPVAILGGGSAPSGCNVYGALIASGTIETDLGGSMCYRYNSCAQRDLFRNRPYNQLSFREMPD
jgi:hypothetical protein